jgi:hypothetical protein
MAAITITAASVVGGEGKKDTRPGGTGTITAGQAVRRDGAAVVAAVNDSAANAAAFAIALNGGAINQPIQYQEDGLITIGGTVVVGMPYALGTAGGIIPVSDIAAGIFTTIIGVGVSATQIKLGFNAGGFAAASDVT